jgi:hypothetical protein
MLKYVNPRGVVVGTQDEPPRPEVYILDTPRYEGPVPRVGFGFIEADPEEDDAMSKTNKNPDSADGAQDSQEIGAAEAKPEEDRPHPRQRSW